MSTWFCYFVLAVVDCFFPIHSEMFQFYRDLLNMLLILCFVALPFQTLFVLEEIHREKCNFSNSRYRNISSTSCITFYWFFLVCLLYIFWSFRLLFMSRPYFVEIKNKYNKNHIKILCVWLYVCRSILFSEIVLQVKFPSSDYFYVCLRQRFFL